MKRRELVFLVAGLLLIVGVAAVLKQLKARQRLAEPGLKTRPIPGSIRLQIDMPTNVPGYTAQAIAVDKGTVEALPSDTSFAPMRYLPDGGTELDAIQTMVVLMGSDRTSLHKPQFCLGGQGWTIDPARSEQTVVHFDRPQPVDLPVIRLVASRVVERDGQKATYSCVFVYWLVAADAVVADHNQIMWRMTRHVLETGELQRWAYIYYFAPCLPGREAATFERVCRLMRATVPEFQRSWPAPETK